MEPEVEQKKQARDPSTTPQMLLLLARVCPEDVLANPALPLLLLEDPSFEGIGNKMLRFARLRELALPLERKLAEATARAQRLFACDCAERALARFGGDDESFLQEALVGARALAEGKLPKERLDQFQEELFAHCFGYLNPSCHIIDALFQEDACKAAREASLWAAVGVYGYELTLTRPMSEVPAIFLPGEEEQSAERAWQMERLEYYLGEGRDSPVEGSCLKGEGVSMGVSWFSRLRRILRRLWRGF